MYALTERVLILQYRFALRTSADLREARNSAYFDKEVPKITTIHRLVTKLRDRGSFCDIGQHLQARHSATMKEHKNSPFVNKTNRMSQKLANAVAVTVLSGKICIMNSTNYYAVSQSDLPLLRNIMIALVLNTDSKASLLTSSQTFL